MPSFLLLSRFSRRALQRNACRSSVIARMRSAISLGMGQPSVSIRRLPYRLRLQRSEPLPNAKLCESRNTADSQLLHDLLTMSLDGFDAYRESGGDFLGRLALGDQLKHLQFAFGESFAFKDGALRGFTSFIAERSRFRDAGTQIHLPFTRGVERRG